MLTVRIIPCLDLKDGKVVKGVNFQGLRDAGDPAERALLYEKQGADELVALDVSATEEGRRTALHTIASLRKVLAIPLTAGGGVKCASDAEALLEAGADKVAINTAGVERPGLIKEIALKFGSQCAILAIDARRAAKGWTVLTHSGNENTGIDAIEWAKKAVDFGCGEIVLTSWDRDGTGSGYDLELIAAVAEAVRVPVIASGGASTIEHLASALHRGAAAVLAASIFHDNILTVSEVKRFLSISGFEVRL